ncbi:TPA: hypothetical protein QDC51_001448 [Burkholderia multivorans]|nr:hypothetical protein [Burkholderia multivorans]HDR9840806.1 hypothetical protein [Burkholderia multivorans]HDR9847328.1 hypothetical protein [Burkholderia multivorans]HDR9853742.1 hypothetical protein [Burkholderia multivorans]
MRAHLRAAMATALLSTAVVAHADPMTGARLREWIASDDGALHLAATMYITGVSDDDALLQAGQRKGLADRQPALAHACPARRANGEALRRSVARFIDENPEYRNEAAVVSVRRALTRDYPCHG